jgi:hypothetical protein
MMCPLLQVRWSSGALHIVQNFMLVLFLWPQLVQIISR